jgi:hypothetical protein
MCAAPPRAILRRRFMCALRRALRALYGVAYTLFTVLFALALPSLYFSFYPRFTFALPVLYGTLYARFAARFTCTPWRFAVHLQHRCVQIHALFAPRCLMRILYPEDLIFLLDFARG